ncbi:hypothetical protein LIER_05287 [Lithospermum erythrorhizon]|uniref:Reverse transcriptase Ty1/copia-type domain-containing protein n=1 Tax=Lithospermum erythrorhizon TaxID=34254 RepID=A0AAV3P1A8_LITER
MSISNFVAFTSKISTEDIINPIVMDHSSDNISDNKEELTEEELMANYQMLFIKWSKLTQAYTTGETARSELVQKNQELTRPVEEQKTEICILEEKIQGMIKGIKMMNISTNVLDQIFLRPGKGILSVEGLPELEDVLLVEGLTANLISISQLCDNGMKVAFRKEACCVNNSSNQLIMLTGYTELTVTPSVNDSGIESATRIQKDHPIDNIKGQFNEGLTTKKKDKVNYRKMIEGINFEETFAPVARHEAIQLLFSLASLLKFKLYQIDVKSVFLNGIVQEEVYVEQPKGLIDTTHPDHVYRLKKALYGLKQSPRAWYERLVIFVLKNGYIRGGVDNTLFIKKEKDLMIVAQIYVDDIVFGGVSNQLVKQLIQQIEAKFEMRMESRPQEVLAKDPPTLQLSWKENVAHDEINLGHGDQIQTEHNTVGEEGSLYVLPIEDDTGKTENPSSDSLERIWSTDTLIRSDGDSDSVDIPVSRVDMDVGVDVNHPYEENAGGDKVVAPEIVSGSNVQGGVDVEAVDEPADAVDVEELEKLAEKRKAAKNDNRNIINNKRIAKDVPTEGVDFNFEEHEARWKFICARTILPERANEGITCATLKLADIIGELTGNALSTWPTKGQLQASTPNLKYVVLHKAVIVNLVPTSNNTNVSEALGRLLINQHPTVLKAEDGFGEDAKSLTISDRGSCRMLIKAYEEEQQRLEAEIQVKKVRASELQAKIQALKANVLLDVNGPATTSTAIPETSQSPM